MNSAKKISICIACFNEEQNVEKMYSRIVQIMQQVPQYDYEIIFEDNCSTDDTANILRNLAQQDKRLKIIINESNFGPMANATYICYQITGDAMIGLPCDFQEPPEMIPEFIKEWEKGYKVVLGQKTSSDESKIFYAIRTLYYKIINLFSEKKQLIHVDGFGIFDKEVIWNIKNLHEPVANFRNNVVELGYNVKLIPYKQSQRQNGKSSYTLKKYLGLAIDTFIATETYAIRLIIIMGTFLSFFSFLGLIVSIILLCLDIIDINILMFSIVFLLLSILIFATGLVGETCQNLLHRMRNKPIVIEKERINFEE